MTPFATPLKISRNNIAIAAIQETHNDRTDRIIIKDYELFSGCATSSNNTEFNNGDSNNTAGVVAISIRRSIINDARKIIRINGRITEILLRNGVKNQTISILNTYAPI